MDDQAHSTLHTRQSLRSYPLGRRLRGLFALVGSVALMLSCGKPKVEQEHLDVNIDSAYMMLTRDVEMLVSDSGYTRYRLSSPLWVVYDRPDRRQWVFAEGLEMWSVDSVRPGNQLVTADTAVQHVDEEYWELIGNVRIHGLRGERLYTPHLHWRRRDKRLYSNDTTYFYTEGKVLRGNRFEAADDLSWYSIYQSSGDFEVEDRPDTLSSSVSATPSIEPTAMPTKP